MKSTGLAAVVPKSLLLLEFDGNVLENLRSICKDSYSAVCVLLTFLSCLPGRGWKWAAASWHSWSRRWSSARRPCTGRPRGGAGSDPGSAA